MLVSLLFDTEDYTSPAALGLDNIVGWLARIMTEEGVTGTFLVIPRKARTMLERGRTDVLDAMRRHEIGLHTARGSEHPTVVEYLEGSSWDDGVEKTMAIERKGLEELEAVFETAIATCSRHGGSWAPQFVAACGRLGRPVVYSHASPPSVGVGWYAGALNLKPWIEILEAAYSDPARMDERLEVLGRELTAAAGTEPWMGVFCGHPCMFKTLQFWDGLNYADGFNRPQAEWRVPDCRGDAQVEAAKEGFRRLVRFVRDHPGVEMAPVAEFVRRWGVRRERANRQELVDLARRALGGPGSGNRTLLADETLSPAQQLVGFARAVLAPEAHEILLGDPLGPTDDPRHLSARTALDWPHLSEMAERVDQAAQARGRLPANLEVAGGVFNIGAVYFALAEALVQLTEGGREPTVRSAYFAPRWPPHGSRIAAEFVDDVEGWPIHKPHINTDEMARLTRLMAWTIRRCVRA